MDFVNTGKGTENLVIENPNVSGAGLYNWSIDMEEIVPVYNGLYDAIVRGEVDKYEKFLATCNKKNAKYLFSHLQLAVLNNQMDIADKILVFIDNNYHHLKMKPPIYLVRPVFMEEAEDPERYKEYYRADMMLKLLKEHSIHVIIVNVEEEV